MKLSSALCCVFATLTVAFPSDYLKIATWGVEGYAKDNPIGVTTGGKGGKTVTVTTAEQLVEAVKGNAPKIVKLKGKIVLPARLAVGSNTSLIGVGLSAHITGKGLNIYNGDNVIVQNLKITEILDNDCITIRNSTRVWIDHNEFSSDIDGGPDKYDGQVDIIRASDFITVSWNYFHDHWKSSLVGNDATFRDLDLGHLHVTYHHNYWRHMGTRGPAGRFGHQHIYNNLYEDFLYQAIHSRSDNQVLVEGNVFRGNTSEALSTYGLVIPMDSPNTCVCGDEELDGYANLGAKNDWGHAGVNITQKGNFYKADYKFKLTPLPLVPAVVKLGAGIGRICLDQVCDGLIEIFTSLVGVRRDDDGGTPSLLTRNETIFTQVRVFIFHEEFVEAFGIYLHAPPITNGTGIRLLLFQFFDREEILSSIWQTSVTKRTYEKVAFLRYWTAFKSWVWWR
ncbi:hypothetical protein HG531_004834 [Fusarium graminearum]|nr:hypothetical protein HG531_004834 [Fusarium graminearum]